MAELENQILNRMWWNESKEQGSDNQRSYRQSLLKDSGVLFVQIRDKEEIIHSYPLPLFQVAVADNLGNVWLFGKTNIEETTPYWKKFTDAKLTMWPLPKLKEKLLARVTVFESKRKLLPQT